MGKQMHKDETIEYEVFKCIENQGTLWGGYRAIHDVWRNLGDGDHKERLGAALKIINDVRMEMRASVIDQPVNSEPARFLNNDADIVIANDDRPVCISFDAKTKWYRVVPISSTIEGCLYYG